MKTKDKFEQLCNIINDMNDAELKNLDFKSLCEENGLDFVKMDNMFYACFGMSGDEYARHICSK